MTIAIYAGGILFLVFCALLYVMRKDTLARGKLEEAHESDAQTLDQLKKAHLAVVHINSDPEYAKRVRERFEKK